MRVAITGGPGAGKTALLELVRRRFCVHVAVLPESASILFGGGFPRTDDTPGRRAAQRAIATVQHELERMVEERGGTGLVVCDRGTIDGLAYWPGDPAELWAALHTTRDAELARYEGVIHLRTPAADEYDHSNPVRVETPTEAAAIDARILAAWDGHPRRVVVPANHDFLDKMQRAVAALEPWLPACCNAQRDRRAA